MRGLEIRTQSTEKTHSSASCSLPPLALNPLPIPVKRNQLSDEDPAWPVKIKGPIFVRSTFVATKRTVLVTEPCSMYLINRMGHFGRSSVQNRRLFCHQKQTTDDTTTTKEVEEEHTDTKQEQREEQTDIEHLVLQLYEAFFLSYALGCLIVVDSVSNQLMDLDQQWLAFCQAFNSANTKEFVHVYACYHYFRSKGWVVKDGSIFGCAFTLYRDSPSHYHALYGVHVMAPKNPTCSLSSSDETQLRDWRSVCASHRVLQTVKKELVLAVLYEPKFDNETTNLTCDISRPDYIRSLRIETLVISRWLINKRQDDKTLDQQQ